MAIVEMLAGRRTRLPEPLDPARPAALPPTARTVGLDAAAAITAAESRHKES